MARGKDNTQNLPADISLPPPTPTRRGKSPLSYCLKLKPLDMINPHHALNTTRTKTRQAIEQHGQNIGFDY